MKAAPPGSPNRLFGIAERFGRLCAGTRGETVRANRKIRKADFLSESGRGFRGGLREAEFKQRRGTSKGAAGSER